jgi:hypothetical protein
MRLANLALAIIAPAACHSTASFSGDAPGSTKTDARHGDGGNIGNDNAAADAAAPAPAAADAAAGDPIAWSTFASQELCKLLANRNSSDPTPNDVQHRSNMLGADLGIPVVVANTVYLFFGDTLGFEGIWGWGQPGDSHPDAVGYGTDSADMIATNPELLCSDMRIISLPASQSVGPSLDPSIVADFAGAAMIAPPGDQLDTYIHYPAGDGNVSFPNLPGEFEVPSGGFAYDGSIYVFYTTVNSPSDLTMEASYLATWSQPSAGAMPVYQILYPVDERFDGNGALGGNFINISAEVSGDYVYLFGTGAFRASGIAIARKRLDSLATPGGFEQLGWVTGTPGYGETSVRYYPEIGQWMLLAQQTAGFSYQVTAYFATSPEGPWSGPTTLLDSQDGTFRATYCCTTDDNCDGVQMFDCDRTAFYATYLMPRLNRTQNSFTVTYTMSSFAPYNVALFQTTFSN